MENNQIQLRQMRRLAKLRRSNVLQNWKALSELRKSAHKLEIEKGRYVNVSRNDRICRNCDSGLIKDEKHFILKCSVYLVRREGLFSVIRQELGIDLKLSGSDGIKAIFPKKDVNIIIKLVVFIRNCREMRTSLSA